MNHSGTARGGGLSPKIFRIRPAPFVARPFRRAFAGGCPDRLFVLKSREKVVTRQENGYATATLRLRYGCATMSGCNLVNGNATV